ncbi:MAG: adenylosuccinate lyase [candidate division Zixibacteria bacterium]|nr:adenylosuccinate lyase [candidate division Zixibacteria bacterium]
MIPRYTLPEMGQLWSDENKFRTWLDVEIAACEAWAGLGKIPKSAVVEIKRKADFDVERILEIEEETKHDVIAFLTNVAEYVGPKSKYIHYGMTSSDILDISLSITIQKAAVLIRKRLVKVIPILKTLTRRYAKTICIGRTHGVHAEPTVFGLKMALWYREMKRNIERFDNAVKGLAVGKVSGAVGNFAHVDPRVERYVCKSFKLRPAKVSTQIIQRDRHADFLNVLALIGGSLEKFATEVRNLQRTEIGEVEEGFAKKQKGSSAMPHKKNPITVEKIAGLSRVLRGNALAGMENQALWHERDITHSSVERVIIPDSCIIMDYVLSLFESVLKGLVVNVKKMKENVYLGGGLVFSQRILLTLTAKMTSREQAYKTVQTLAMRARDNNESFKELVKSSPEVKRYMSDDEIEECFDVTFFTKMADVIIKRALK